MELGRVGQVFRGRNCDIRFSCGEMRYLSERNLMGRLEISPTKISGRSSMRSNSNSTSDGM